VFQSFATLDLISKGRAEMMVGRGSFTESFPLFGLDLAEYDAIFAEKLGLLLQIRDNEFVTWEGKFRPKLENQAIYPRPLQNPFPIHLGVGGTPESFVRAGTLGLPLAVAVIGGETHRFKPLVDLYRDAWKMAGHPEGKEEITLHSLGYVGEDFESAVEEYYPGYKEGFSRIGKERGWPPITRERFDRQISETGAFVVGGPKEVAEKIMRHSEALGGIERFTFQMDNAGLSHEQLSKAIEKVGKEVVPLIKKATISS
jgi:alkanesulfonate monooxygenase SsuD/methylene tetrahydromethanopterin reductase-like flavin-dependent oxidoreductase (luciferase family)